MGLEEVVMGGGRKKKKGFFMGYFILAIGYPLIDVNQRIKLRLSPFMIETTAYRPH